MAYVGKNADISWLGSPATSSPIANLCPAANYSSASFICGIALSFFLGIIFLINYIFGEIGWRGFLQKELQTANYLKPAVIGLLWTLWLIPLHVYSTESATALLPMLVKNIALSYLLFEVLRRAKSIWFTAALLGIEECASTIAANSTVYASIISVIVIWAILRFLWPQPKK